LRRNKDILSDVAVLVNPPFCVGFAAESEHVIEHASQKRISKKLPLIVANEVSAMGSNDNEVTLIDETGTYPLKPSTKTKVAYLILEHMSKLLP
ncbi:MAG TPA: phosphopantothenoylcysteine decarboxylase, partial [Methylophilaceae bacterium]|nr:phosphopantothenoylcysteine decarboxylase [Methylophilaceae bacterium]